VKLAENIPQYRRDFIANGIRAFLRDDLSFVFDILDLRASLDSSLSLFSLFSVIVGTIALILAFFLLLTSTNANIRDNFWELGVLKAIGLSKRQC
jgi:ABC-type antimicrobial peptide transport system permease subunit